MHHMAWTAIDVPNRIGTVPFSRRKVGRALLTVPRIMRQSPVTGYTRIKASSYGSRVVAAEESAAPRCAPIGMPLGGAGLSELV